MIRCSQCKSTSARIVSGREINKLSKSNYTGPLVAAAGAATASAAVASATTLGAVGVTAAGAKAASESGVSPLAKVAIAGASALAGYGAKLLVDRIAAKLRKHVYCSACGHLEPLKGD